MKRRTMIFILCFYIFFSCSERDQLKKEKASTSSNINIAGIYVNESTNEVINMSTGKVVGTETLRDTIFIIEKESGYEVNNSKYRFNDYDKFGWTRISGTGKLPTFQDTFDKTDSSLTPIQNQFVEPIYIDLNKQRIYKSISKDNPYEK